jgi:SpoVK/Ycf46/Vps4 family AAA+-type ATPase
MFLNISFSLGNKGVLFQIVYIFLIRSYPMCERILILGAPGTGKNWTGERIAKNLGIPFYDTDDIAWKQKYTLKRSHKEKCEIINKIIKT